MWCVLCNAIESYEINFELLLLRSLILLSTLKALPYESVLYVFTLYLWIFITFPTFLISCSSFYADNICTERRPTQSLPTLYRTTPYYGDDTVEVTMNLREVSQCPEKVPARPSPCWKRQLWNFVKFAALVTTETSPVRGDEALPGLGLRGLGQVPAGVGGVGGGPGHERRVSVA